MPARTRAAGGQEREDLVRGGGRQLTAPAVAHLEAVEHQAIDPDEHLHRAISTTWSIQAKSASCTGFSIFRISVFAASNTIGMVTREPRFAARNAAASATLWTLPPVSVSRARRSKSSPCVGVLAWNTRWQITRRSACPGNG